VADELPPFASGFSARRTLHLAVGTAALLLVTGCQSLSSPTPPPQVPRNLSDPCVDFEQHCRDQCAPEDPEKMACYRDAGGRVHRICECKGNPIRE
jgi:hypothetical protein